MNQFYQPRILIVDDDQVLCELLSEQLKELKFFADYTLDGKDALKKIEKETYNLVILDLNMPGMDGDKVLPEIKKYDPTLPVIMISAQTHPSYIVKCIKLGAEDYFTKPYDYDNILDAIIKYFK